MAGAHRSGTTNNKQLCGQAAGKISGCALKKLARMKRSILFCLNVKMLVAAAFDSAMLR